MGKSILQDNDKRCYLCGRYACGDPLDKHHVFGGAFRKKSEQYGLTVHLHHFECHIFGDESAHKNHSVDLEIKEKAQRVAMDYYGWTEDEFRGIFGKNYL
ncbi:MAG: hypothetical protein Q4C12_08910 [Clostridia bacterium]|nr:hypothetical protein [Clostridia bacterium]